MDNLSTSGNTPPADGAEDLSRVEEKNVACAQAIHGVLAPLPPTRAALLALCDEQAPATVTITLPVGVNVTFAVHSCDITRMKCYSQRHQRRRRRPRCHTWSQLCSTLSWRATPGIQVDGGVGVGRVTKPGLGLEVGSAAINQVSLRHSTKGGQHAFDHIVGVVPIEEEVHGTHAPIHDRCPGHRNRHTLS